MSEITINRVLEFPEGDFLIAHRKFNQGDSVFFKPKGSDKAYSTYGPNNMLMGKTHRELDTRSNDFKKYDLTYEVEDDTLIAARLISKFSKSAGTLADDATVQQINTDLQNGNFEIVKKKRSPEISCAATLPNGETLLVVNGLKENEWDHSLFIGQPDNFQELTLTNGLQGGNRLCFTVEETGDRLEYDYRGNAFGNKSVPFYGDHVLRYIDLDDYENLGQFGLNANASDPHLDPFCPELTQP